MEPTAIEAALDHLRYWADECDKARAAGDTGRLATCQRFIRHCEIILKALESAC